MSSVRQRGVVRTVGRDLAVVLAFAMPAVQASAAQSPPIEAGSDQVTQLVAAAALRFGIPEHWIYAVMRVESAGDMRALSAAGAMGLMQIMPATWSYLRARYGLGPDPFDVRDNIMGGAAWLSELHDRYGLPGAFAAYNAGPARYEDHLATGRPLPAETRAYLTWLAPIIGGSTALRPLVDPFAWTRATLFAAHGNGASAADIDVPQPATEGSVSGPPNSRGGAVQAAIEPPTEGLFIPLSGQAPR